MSSSAEEFIPWAFVFGIGVGCLCCFCLRTCDLNIQSGKQFILKNATYKCLETNELKEEDSSPAGISPKEGK